MSGQVILVGRPGFCWHNIRFELSAHLRWLIHISFSCYAYIVIMKRIHPKSLLPLLLVPGQLLLSTPASAGDEPYISWQAEGLAIPEPIGGLQGDPRRGRAVVVDRSRGSCLACHLMPIPEEPMHGTVGPPLYGIGSRLSEAELRLRVVDEKRLNPHTIMPGFYRHPDEINRPHPQFTSTVLTAQEVEDVVAYLVTLK